MLHLGLPSGWPEPVIDRPDLSGALLDYPAALQAALEEPEGSQPLEKLHEPGARVAIVVDDPSRWTPVREAMPIVLQRLAAAGVARTNISISVGVGRHHAVDERAMRRRLGDAVVRDYACFSPPLDDRSQYVDLGVTPEGVPVCVFRPVAEADLRILVGSVLPHLQAGFGGGFKLIFPGCSHRQTLGALHRQGLGENPEQAAALLGGSVATNPMRLAISHAASRLSGACVSISHLLGAPGQIFHVRFGDVSRVQELLSAQALQRFRLPDRPPVDLAVAGNFPWPGDPMMSFKALIHHRDACRPGGVLVGLFWTDPHEIDRSFPIGPMRAIAGSGALGGWFIRRALRLADRLVATLGLPSRFMLHWARELVAERAVLVYSPPLRDRLGPRLGPIQLFSELPPLWQAAEAAIHRPPATLRVFPEGGLSYVAHHLSRPV
jgi:hypothetical protein